MDGGPELRNMRIVAAGGKKDGDGACGVQQHEFGTTDGIEEGTGWERRGMGIPG